ncbi:MAG TPA: hypothetical protein VGE97_08615 [Nitrososphaera sp.]
MGSVGAFEPGKPVECIVIGTASEPDVNDTTRAHYVQMLITGLRSLPVLPLLPLSV